MATRQTLTATRTRERKLAEPHANPGTDEDNRVKNDCLTTKHVAQANWRNRLSASPSVSVLPRPSTQGRYQMSFRLTIRISARTNTAVLGKLSASLIS